MEMGGEREREKDRHGDQFALVNPFIGWFLYVSWPGVEPTTFVYWDNAPTHWDTQLGLKSKVFKMKFDKY